MSLTESPQARLQQIEVLIRMGVLHMRDLVDLHGGSPEEIAAAPDACPWLPDEEDCTC